MMQLIRANTGLFVWLMIFTGGGLVVAFVAYWMKARGLSLKPVWWFIGFMLLIGLPQLVYHAIVAASSGVAGLPDSKVEDPQSLFNVVPEGATVVDIPPQAAAGLLSTAEKGRFITLPNQDTMMIAQFASGADAMKSVATYLSEAGLESSAEPDGAGGFIVPGAGRFAQVYARGNVLVVHTSAGKATGKNAGNTVSDPMAKLTSTGSGKIAVAVALLVYTLLVAIYFLKGLTWATRIEAKKEARVLSASELRDRLMTLNSLDIPFQIEPGREGELNAIWRYADAKWVDLARAHGFRRIHRIRLSLDEAHRKIRATDYQSAYDWSIGRGGGSFEWKAEMGIVFFQYEHQRVYGLQLDDHGRPRPKLSYSYTFDLQEMKSPLIDAITGAGWHWQPVAWQAPARLRWLLE